MLPTMANVERPRTFDTVEEAMTYHQSNNVTGYFIVANVVCWTDGTGGYFWVEPEMKPEDAKNQWNVKKEKSKTETAPLCCKCGERPVDIESATGRIGHLCIKCDRDEWRTAVVNNTRATLLEGRAFRVMREKRDGLLSTLQTIRNSFASESPEVTSAIEEAIQAGSD